MYIVYILISKKDHSRYYIGITQDLNKRLKEHTSERIAYAKRYAPWEIETYISFKNKRLAEEFEKYLKVGSGHAFFKKKRK